ncbi:MAG: hypothetical protein AAF580_03315 [Pseudomonadota bacterium]
MKRTASLSLAIVLSLSHSALLPVDRAAAQSCLTGHELREAVRSGSVLRPAQITGGMSGQVLQVKLCRSGQGLVWQVTELGSNGQVIGHVIDARTGQRLR